MFVSILILNKLNLYYFTNHWVLYWLILIPKRRSLDSNLKRGTFDQSKYLRSCDVTYFLFFGVLASKHKSIEIEHIGYW